jgi:hypothetical protein
MRCDCGVIFYTEQTYALAENTYARSDTAEA